MGPSASHWVEGAELLAGEPLHGGEIKPGTEVSSEVMSLAKSVHELGSAAKDAEEPAEKVALYGKLLSKCAACHGKTR